MKRIFLFTVLLVLGLILSQLIPTLVGPLPTSINFVRTFIMMTFLSYIMIEVGREFEIDLKNKRHYLIDYGVAATAAAFPWILVTAYFLLFLMPETSSTGKPLWVEALLAGRFAAPTSAGVLFSMLAAAGLSSTWVFKKTRILAIFDDLDTVILMIPLQILMVGLVWQLGGILVAIGVMLILGWKYYRKASWPASWPWVFLYAFGITLVSETLYYFTKNTETNIGLHIEVLLPAFLLGCALKTRAQENVTVPGEDEPGTSHEETAGLFVSCAFMFLVGFSMPLAFGEHSVLNLNMSAGTVIFHVIMITLLSNIGKMFASVCYRKEASLKERIAVSVAMFPRGEVGAGVLAVSLGYGISGAFVAIAFLSLALNLMLTGLFILIVKKLLMKKEHQIYARKGPQYAH